METCIVALVSDFLLSHSKKGFILVLVYITLLYIFPPMRQLKKIFTIFLKYIFFMGLVHPTSLLNVVHKNMQ